MGTRVIKTAGQVAFEGLQGELKTPMPWDDCSIKAAWEAFAAKHNIQSLTEGVAEKPTDGELLVKAYDTSCNGGNDAIAAEFLRLRAERDGESLPVTSGLLNGWMNECCSSYVGLESSKLAERVNQHRGVRPVPQVTQKMWGLSHGVYARTRGNADDCYQAAADYLNAELAKAATVTPVTPVKVAGFVCIDGSLHTFEDVNELKAFRDDDNWEFGQTWEIIQQYEHHPRKDGTP